MKIVYIDPRKRIIAPSSWPKKGLADVHLELLLFCQFACLYCSSNAGLHLRFLKETIQAAVSKVIGEIFDPQNAAHIVIGYREIVKALDRELSSYRRKPGAGKTLVLSQLTDPFSPVLLQLGITRMILELLLEKTEYRIRILTKNAIVGTPEWVRFFAEHADRFVVGLSIGTLDAAFARKMERLTSLPEARIRAHRALQDAGVPTYTMLCPVLPQVLDSDEFERLVDGIRPELCEDVWAEPYNERDNWEHVREAFEPGSSMWDWMTDVYDNGKQELWSTYTASLYERILALAVLGGWQRKLHYLLYEDGILASDASRFRGLVGVLLQSKANSDGTSKNPAFAAMQRSAR